MSLSNINKAKLTYQKIDTNTILKSSNITGLDSLQSLLVSKEQELNDRFLTTLLKIMQDTGIDITTMPPKLPDFCPTKETLDKAIDIRNNLVTNLNGLSKTLNIVAGTVTATSTIFEVASKLPQIIGIIKTAISLGVKFIPSPPGTPGIVTSALSDLEDLKKFLLFKSDGSARLVETKNKIERLALTIDIFTAAVSTILLLLDLLDQLINKCTKTNLVSVNSNLVSVNSNLVSVNSNLVQQTKKTITTPNQASYQGFLIKIVDMPFNAKISRRKAVGYDIQGIPLIETPLSFTTNSQVLIDELKLYIDQNNLKAY
jgi:hypothetical protein